jgi:hypothetical protein
MQYLLLIYADEVASARMGQAEMGKLLADYGAFSQSIVSAGQFKAGDRLRPTAEAKTVRLRDGKATVIDGPFAETREQLGGYYLVEAEGIVSRGDPPDADLVLIAARRIGVHRPAGTHAAARLAA